MNTKALRRILGVTLVIAALLATQIPTGEVSAKTSEKTDFQLDGNTLVKYTGTAQTVSVPNSVEIIGEEAFANNDIIETVSLPKNIKKISYGAFSNCSSLKKIAVPDKCEEISNAAFSNCSSLKTVSIGAGIEKLGNGIFIGCNKLNDFQITGKEFVNTNGVIYDKNKEKLIEVIPGKKKEKVNIPDTVTYIYPYAFYGCDTVKSVTLSSNIKEIPAFAFSNAKGIKEIVIPYSVETIDTKAFENCVNLRNVEIPESVRFIHSTAFDGCPYLNIKAMPETYAYKWFKDYEISTVKSVDDEDNDDIITDDSNDNNKDESKEKSEKEDKKNKKEEPFSYDVSGNDIGVTKVVGRNAVFFIDNSKQNVVTEDNNEISEAEAVMPEVTYEPIQIETSGKGVNIPKFINVDGRIASRAYYGDTGLKEFTIDDDITSIGDFAFSRTGLETIVIPQGVTSIGYGAFYHCDNLKTVVVPTSVKSIETSAFDKTRMLENFMLYGINDYLVLGDGILIAYKGNDTEVEIPSYIKMIGGQAFKNNKNITEISLPDSVKIIGEEAFMGCSNLKSINGGNCIEEIRDRAFDSCPIESIKISDTVRKIGSGAFDFTGTNISKDSIIAYFFSDKLPELSSEKTTTRLTNKAFRKDALCEVKVCVVKNDSVNLSGTVLDKNLSGFSGIICTISKNADGLECGELKVIAANLTKEEAESFSVPSKMCLFSKYYEINQESLNDVLAKIIESDDVVSFENTVRLDSNDEDYIVDINKDNSLDSIIQKAYDRVYAGDIPKDFVSFEISIKEKDNSVKITKLGKQTMHISMNLFENVPTKNMHLVTVDEDGQLEDLKYVVDGNDGEMKLEFDIDHGGKYALYSTNPTQSDLINPDDTPETGDGIHPKWFLSLGLLLAAIAVFLIKGK